MTKELENKREIWRREKKIFIVVHMQKTRSQSGRACKYVHVICDKIDVIMRKNSRCHWGSYKSRAQAKKFYLLGLMIL